MAGFSINPRGTGLLGVWLLVGLLLAGCAAQRAPTTPTLEAKIGQMLMVGFRGMAVNETDFIVRDIRQHHLGGVILFDYDVVKKTPVRNIESPAQVKALAASLQKISPTPLLIAIDQEGGMIARLKEGRGFPPTVSHRTLGRADDLRMTLEQTGRLAATLADLGIGLNLAPVVDLCTNPDNPVIAKLDRCFSADPEKVTRHALSYIAAHHQQGVLTTLKHFPGHGSSRNDSHQGFTDVTETWSATELEPYARIIASGQIDAIMTAHVFNARLDAQDPATLSPATISGLLRGKLGFAGVVISDDMQMGAIVDHYGFETAIRKALQAGVDVLVFGNNLDYDEKIVPRAIAVIRSLIDSGAISEARIDQSYRRIMRLKSRSKHGPMRGPPLLDLPVCQARLYLAEAARAYLTSNSYSDSGNE
jgi:beta-N-acetylhexosaminidase